MSIRSMIAAASAFALACSPSLASAQTSNSSAAQSVSISDVEQRLSADGFRVFEIERYPNSIEVKGLDRNGLCVEMHLDPRTGDVLRRERDDDCGSGRGDDDRGRRDHH